MSRAPTRPGFPGERTVERWLREGGAAYDVWATAAAHGDDRAAAWHALTSLDAQLTFARLLTNDDDALGRALAQCLRDLLDTHAHAPWVTLARTTLDHVLASTAPSPSLLAELAATEKVIIAARYERTRRGEPLDRDSALSIVRACSRLASGGLSRALGGIHWLDADVPDLSPRLKRHLDPLVGPALSPT
jgi:hypothetical protein